MLIAYLAAGTPRGSDVAAGLGGLIASGAAALAGFLAIIQFGVLGISRRSPDDSIKRSEHHMEMLDSSQKQRLKLVSRFRGDVSRRIRNWNSTDAREEPETTAIANVEGLVLEATVKEKGDLQAIQRMLELESIAIRNLQLTKESQARVEMIRNEAYLKQISSLFRHARLAFYAFLGISLISSGILLYGAYLAIYGHVASGVIVALSSAVPGGFSAGLFRISRSADDQARKGLDMLDREVERETQIDRMLNAVTEINDVRSQGAIQTLSALRAAFPSASPKELTSLLNAIRNDGSKASKAE